MDMKRSAFKNDSIVLDHEDMKLLFGGHTLSQPGLTIRLDCSSVKEVTRTLYPHPVGYKQKDYLITLSCKCGERAGLTSDIWQPNMTCIECGFAVHKKIVKEVE